MAQFVAALPKVELHLHLVRSASPETVLALARRHPDSLVPAEPRGRALASQRHGVGWPAQVGTPRAAPDRAAMIPTLILFGLVFGRWWRLALIAAAIGWPVLLLATGTAAAGPVLIGAAGVAIANTGAGVTIHQGARWVVRRYRQARRGKAVGKRSPSHAGDGDPAHAGDGDPGD